MKTAIPEKTVGSFLRILVVCCVAAGLGCVACFRATAATYTSRAAFEAELTSVNTVTFEQLTPSDGNSTGSGQVDSDGVVFSSTGVRLFITSTSTGVYPIAGTGQYLWNFDSGYPVDIQLPAGMTAFGADFSGGIEPNDTFNATLTARLVGGATFNYDFSGSRNSWTFFGVTFDEPIASLTYTDGGTYVMIGTHEEMLDNVTFGTVVPEPGFLSLMLVAAFLSLRRRN